MIIGDSKPRSVTLRFDGNQYIDINDEMCCFQSTELVRLAADGSFVGTMTARHGANADSISNPQPILWTLGPIEKQSGHQDFPILHPDQTAMKISGRYVDSSARVFVDGRRVPGTVRVDGKDKLKIELTSLPKPGLHLLQVQNPEGRFSNDFLFNVTNSSEAAKQLVVRRARFDRDIRDAIADAVAGGDLEELRRHLSRRQQGGRVNEQQPRSGSTPLGTAALHGNLDVAKLLLRRGANVNGKNRDGNTPLHIAAFLCREEFVELLLDSGASPTIKNARGETAVDTVLGPWDGSLAAFYRSVADAVGIELDLERLPESRPRIAELIQRRE
ncbi:MAG: ankyrin repeat domain-containing protein [Planctomycetota bacterium]